VLIYSSVFKDAHVVVSYVGHMVILETSTEVIVLSEKSSFAYKYLRQLMDLQELIGFCGRTYQQITGPCNLTVSVDIYDECGSASSRKHIKTLSGFTLGANILYGF